MLRHTEWYAAASRSPFLACAAEHSGTRLRSGARLWKRSWVASGGCGPLLLESIGKATAVYVASHFSANPPILLEQRRGLTRERLRHVIEYVDAHLSNELSLGELSGIACLNSYHFGRMFKVPTGQSVHQFILCRRIQRAKALLVKSGSSLAEVAAAVGFCGQSQFTTTFRRLMGVPPGLWRREYRT